MTDNLLTTAPTPSQRSIVAAADLADHITLAYRIRLGEVTSNGPKLDIEAELSTLWWKLLYENDFEDWMATQAKKTFKFIWLDVLVKLRNQSFFYSYGNPYGGVVLPEIPQEYRDELVQLGNYYLSRFIALLVREAKDVDIDRLHRVRLLRSLELDGITVDLERLRLVRKEGPVSLDDEKTELERLLDASSLPNRSVAAAHLKSASVHFLDGQDHSSLGESRTFLQSVLDQIAECIAAECQQSVPAGTKHRIEFLSKTKFFTTDEEAAFRAAWGFLSAGNHPGLPEHVQARLGMVLSLEFGQALLIKWSNWKNKDV
jgi:hypothetical protein